MLVTHHRNQFLGLILVLTASFLYGSNATMAKLNFLTGGDTFSFLITRFVVSTALLSLIWLTRRSGPKLTFSQILTGMGLGLLIFAISFCFIAATQFINAGLVTVLLFTFPLWIGLMAWLTGEEKMNPLKVSCLVAAFIGLMLCVGGQFTTAAWEGIALGLLAAVCLAVNIFYGHRLSHHIKSLDLTFLMMWACTLVCIPWLMVDTPTFPSDFGGWSILVGAALMFVTGLFCFFYGMSYLGAVKASLYNNVEPVFSLVLAYLILDEKLTNLQMTGAAIVILSLVSLQWFSREKNVVPV